MTVGNEPNINRFGSPQFGPRGSDVAAPAFVKLLAGTYDALKRADPGIAVDEVGVSPRGGDRPDTALGTHSRPGSSPISALRTGRAEEHGR